MVNLENRTLGMFRKMTNLDRAWCGCDIVTDDRDCPISHKPGKWCPGGSEYEKMYADDGSDDPVTDTDRDEDERTDRDFPGYF